MEGYWEETDDEEVSTAKPSCTTDLVIRASKFQPGGPFDEPTRSRASISSAWSAFTDEFSRP